MLYVAVYGTERACCMYMHWTFSFLFLAQTHGVSETETSSVIQVQGLCQLNRPNSVCSNFSVFDRQRNQNKAVEEFRCVFRLILVRWSSRNQGDQFSHPYKTTDLISCNKTN